MGHLLRPLFLQGFCSRFAEVDRLGGGVPSAARYWMRLAAAISESGFSRRNGTDETYVWRGESNDREIPHSPPFAQMPWLLKANGETLGVGSGLARLR